MKERQPIVPEVMSKCAHLEHGGAVASLVRAAADGHDTCIEGLIVSGADVNTADEKEMTPLVRSVYYGFHKCIDVLIKAGADVNLTYGDKDTALMCAVKYRQEKCFTCTVARRS